MTAPVRGFPIVLLGLLAVGLVLAGLSVEAFTRLEVNRAQRALPGALARTVVPEDATHELRSALATTRRHARRQRFERAAVQLDALAAESPSPELHGLTALAWQAADRGLAAARHTQLAARLAPDDAARGSRAERALNAALAYRARPFTRVAGGAGGLLLLLLVVRGLRVRRARRHLERYLDAVSGRLAFSVDGEAAGSQPTLWPDAESLTVDVFLKGRHGMACPRRPARSLTLRVSFSHAGDSRTVRLRPVRHARDSAVRIPVRPQTLRALLEVPGRWRAHARLGPRTVATAVVDVRSATSHHRTASRRNGALTA